MMKAPTLGASRTTRPVLTTVQALDAPVVTVDLSAEANALRSHSTFCARGHHAKTLVKQPDLRIVLIVMRAGARLQQHRAEHRIAVQTLSGHIRLSLPGPRQVELAAGQMLVLDEKIPHDVVAAEDSAFVLTLTWSAAVQEASSTGFDALHAEHERFHSLLKLLEGQLESFHGNRQPDYDLMHDIFFYLTHYPDRLHHAIEDRVFAKLAERVPEARADVAKLAGQHRRIAESGAQFLESLDAALRGAILTRSAVEEPAREYIALYRAHMELEERTLVPLARAHILPADWAEIRAIAPTEEDPVFGPLTEARFCSLQRHIAQVGACECATLGHTHRS